MLTKRKVERYKRKIERLTAENERLRKECNILILEMDALRQVNTILSKQISKTTLGHDGDVEAFKKLLENVKQIKEEYRKAILQAANIQQKYENEMGILLKRLRKQVRN